MPNKLEILKVNEVINENSPKMMKAIFRPIDGKILGYVPRLRHFFLLNDNIDIKYTYYLNENYLKYYSSYSETRIKLCSPINICWSLINKCNINCQFCIEPRGINGSYGSERKEFLNNILNSGIFSIDFSGGEPLILKDVFELLSIARNNNTFVSLTTNGTFCNSDTIDQIKDVVDLVTVSLDGANSKTHDGLRGCVGLFNICINAIKEMVLKSIPVRINMVVLPQNHKEIRDLMILSKNLGVQDVFLRQFVPLGEGHKNKTKFSISSKFFREITTEIKNEFNSTSFRVSSKELKENHGHIVVRSNGDVYVKRCSETLSDKIEQIYLGNLKYSALKDLFKKLPLNIFIDVKNVTDSSKIYPILDNV